MGWVANIFILIGMFLIGEKNRTAFLFSITGEAIWALYAAIIGMWDLAIICIVFCIVAFRNWVKWGRDENIHSPTV